MTEGITGAHRGMNEKLKKGQLLRSFCQRLLQFHAYICTAMM